MIEVHCGLDGQLKAEAGTSASELYHSCKAKFGTDGVLFVKGSRVEIQSSHQAVQEGAYDWRASSAAVKPDEAAASGTSSFSLQVVVDELKYLCSDVSTLCNLWLGSSSSSSSKDKRH